MIISKLMGGLGNQMFQYAVGRALSRQHKCRLYLDKSFLLQQAQTHTARVYALDVFRIEEEFADEELIASISQNERSFIRRQFISILGNPIIREGGSKFLPQLNTLQPPLYLDGFWQDERYFQSIAANIREDFTPFVSPSEKNTALLEQIKTVTAVSLHVRRGDYVSNAATAAFHGNLTPSYYQQAVQLLQEKIGNIHLFIFSDDVNWVRFNMPFNVPTTYIDHNTGRDSHWDLYLMKNCQHHIIANSSFSWWGAWLNPSPQKIVIAPRHWFADANAGGQEIVPSNWLRL
ncbi:MAG: alpha-1,2-fucosyltransferase [Bacteroidia bacterium]